MKVYGIFRRGVLISSVQKEDDIEFPTVQVWTTREAAEAEMEERQAKRPRHYYVGEIEVVE